MANTDTTDENAARANVTRNTCARACFVKVCDVITTLIVAFGVVIIWFAVWKILESVPETETWIWTTLVLGFIGSFICIYAESWSFVESATKEDPRLHLLIKFIHDFLLVWFQIMLWKGWWDLLDLYTKQLFPRACELSLSILILISCRALTVSSSYSIVREDVFSVPISSDTLVKGIDTAANITATLIMVHILSITVWAQCWNITAEFLLPQDKVLSAVTSLFMGIGSLIFLFIFDQTKRCFILCHTSCVYFIVYYVMATWGIFASVQCWRGVWNLSEYLLRQLNPQDHKSVELSILFTATTITYIVMFFAGYNQSVAGYAADFDKLDFDLDEYFLVWASTGIPRDSNVLASEMHYKHAPEEPELEHRTSQEYLVTNLKVDFNKAASVPLLADTEPPDDC